VAEKAGHQHEHIRATSVNSARGIRALQVSIVGLALTAIFQAGVAIAGGSAGLLADTIHNLADIFTAIPLWVAFVLARREANRRFTYGYGRAEDIAGAIVLLFIVGSAILAVTESLSRLQSGAQPSLIELSMLAAFVGFIGNEIVASYKIRVGKEIGSTALIAEGKHSRVDGLTSLAALVGLIGTRLGFAQADALAGLVISVAIVAIAWEVGRDILGRLMDTVEPEMIAQIERIAAAHPDVRGIRQIRARWMGHALTMEMNISVDGHLSIIDAHAIAEQVRHDLLDKFPRLNNVMIHTDPLEEQKGQYHFDGTLD
jgi:cation diffusion facilitator family transporter